VARKSAVGSAAGAGELGGTAGGLEEALLTLFRGGRIRPEVGAKLAPAPAPVKRQAVVRLFFTAGIGYISQLPKFALR
jgi:hypothetical protein